MQREEGCPAAVSVVSMPRLDLDALAWRAIRHHGRPSTGGTRKTREHRGTKGYKQLPAQCLGPGGCQGGGRVTTLNEVQLKTGAA